ncbi:MAG: hypothetical protein PHQ18_01220 [Patescibacteria group bacterium]|nr:hypothetical protein [Patescibacteria group bacterium]
MDTIKLKISYSHKNIKHNPYFKEVSHETSSDKNGRTNYRQIYTNNNWRQEEKQKGNYIPKYSVTYSNYYHITSNLIIEFSVGKLINSENVTPIRDRDYTRVVKSLYTFIRKIGLNKITIKDIEEAVIDTVAIRKDLTTNKFSYEILSEISRVNFRPRTKNFYYTLYKEYNGSSINFGNTNIKFTAYNKIAEIQQTPYKTIAEQKILSKYQKRHQELLRFEFTLKKSQSIKNRWGKYGIQEPKLKDIFCEKIWSDILKREVDKIYGNPITFLSNRAYADKLQKIILDDPNIKASVKEKVLYLIILIQTKGLGQSRKEYGSRQTWSTRIKIVENILQKKAKQIKKQSIGSKSSLREILRLFGIKHSWL